MEQKTWEVKLIETTKNMYKFILKIAKFNLFVKNKDYISELNKHRMVQVVYNHVEIIG